MLPAPRFLATVALSLLSAFATFAQGPAPRVLLRFDNNISDTSGAGIVTTVQPSTGWTPTFGTDRQGNATGALDLTTGSKSLQLVASAFLNNSNQALGLRNAAGTNTSFTLSAWIYCTNVSGGYNTVFGNLGTGAGTLHAGLGSGNAKTHFGFDGNDANGGTVDIQGGTTPTQTVDRWYHVAFVYDAEVQTQRIFINGVPEVTRTGVVNTLKAANLLIGNWSIATDGTNDFRGRLDDVAVYDVALAGDQIHALASSVSPLALPTAGTYSAPKMPGNPGANGTWGVREIRNYSAVGYGTLVNADRIVRGYPITPSGTLLDYQASTINFRDSTPTGAGQSHSFASDASFGTDTAADDNNLAIVAKCAVRIAVEDDYTFSFRGDDGSRLRVLGAQFLSSTKLNTGTNAAEPNHSGDGIYFIAGTGDSHTIGVVHLKPGDYNLELIYWEGSGGSSIEVSAARGAKTAFDSSFKLVGDTASGGLQIVPDPDTITLTIDGGASVFVHGGAPANLTLAWGSAVSPSSMSISPGIGAVAQNGSQSIAAPSQTTTYTLTALFGATTVTRQVTVYVNSPPLITSFTASDTTVGSGASVGLNWSVLGATSLTLNPGGINVTGQSGRTVNPTATTTYTLVAANAAGTTEQSVMVTIGVPPTINSLTIADATPLFGGETMLTWSTSDATGVSLNQGIGAVATTGSAQVTAFQTTTYTLSATNDFGTATSSVVLNQWDPLESTCRHASLSIL